jgi:hypothetical protein
MLELAGRVKITHYVSLPISVDGCQLKGTPILRASRGHEVKGVGHEP